MSSIDRLQIKSSENLENIQEFFVQTYVSPKGASSNRKINTVQENSSFK